MATTSISISENSDNCYYEWRLRSPYNANIRLYCWAGISLTCYYYCYYLWKCVSFNSIWKAFCPNARFWTHTHIETNHHTHMCGMCDGAHLCSIIFTEKITYIAHSHRMCLFEQYDAFTPRVHASGIRNCGNCTLHIRQCMPVIAIMVMENWIVAAISTPAAAASTNNVKKKQ